MAEASQGAARERTDMDLVQLATALASVRGSLDTVCLVDDVAAFARRLAADVDVPDRVCALKTDDFHRIEVAWADRCASMGWEVLAVGRWPSDEPDDSPAYDGEGDTLVWLVRAAHEGDAPEIELRRCIRDVERALYEAGEERVRLEQAEIEARRRDAKPSNVVELKKR